MPLNKKQHSQIKRDTARKTFLDNEYYSCDNKSYSQKINMLINIKHWTPFSDLHYELSIS